MTSLCKIAGVVGVAFFLLAGVASATFIVSVEGDPVVYPDQTPDPWWQTFTALQTDPDHVAFNNLRITITSAPYPATHFEVIPPDTTVFNTDNAAWAETYESATVVAAAGPTPRRNSLTFTLDFSGNPADNTLLQPLQFVVDAYEDTTWVGGMYAQYYQDDGASPDHWHLQDIVVPEPVSMLMLGCVGTGISLARKLYRKRSA